jgi:hypothetical protein
MSIVKYTLDLTCRFINLQKYLQKKRIVKHMKKVNGVIYLRTKVSVSISQVRCGDRRRTNASFSLLKALR